MKNEPTFDVYEADRDGVCVVHVNTDEIPTNAKGPVMRIYLNEAPIWENPSVGATIEKEIQNETVPNLE